MSISERVLRRQRNADGEDRRGKWDYLVTAEEPVRLLLNGVHAYLRSRCNTTLRLCSVRILRCYGLLEQHPFHSLGIVKVLDAPRLVMRGA